MQRSWSHSGDSGDFRSPSSFSHDAPLPGPSRATLFQKGVFDGNSAASTEIEMRLIPTQTYSLGEGRSAKVFLASYRKGKGKGGTVINEKGDGYVGGGWRLCAAKRMAPDRQSQTMGLREAFFLRRLRSKYVIDLIATMEDTSERRGHGRSVSLDTRESIGVSRLVLLLEHAPHGDAATLVKSDPRVVNQQLWRRWARQAVEAVQWIHSQKVIHGDVKPGNLLLTKNLDIRLADFGSSILHSNDPPTDGVGLGTLPYSAPELLDRSKSFSYPIDVYALGVTLQFCISGIEPFRGMRAVERVHHARKGIVWEHEERRRTALIGTPETREEVSSDSLWEAWMKDTSFEVSALLDGTERSLSSPTISRSTSIKRATVIRGPEMTFLSGEEVPEGVKSVLKRMLSPDPHDRPLPVDIIHAI